MRVPVAVPALLFASVIPAHATEWLVCSAADGKASFSVLAGSMGIGTATDFEVQAGGKSWSTKEGQGTPIAKLQAYEDANSILATVSTADLSEVVAELKLFKASENDAYAQGGILRVPGIGAWAVTCPNE